MHWDAPWCIKLHRVPQGWLYFFYINFWIAPSTTKLLFIALFSFYLHRDEPKCTEMHHDAPSTIKLAIFLLYQLLNCTELHPVVFFLLYILLICTLMHRVPPSCTELYLHHDALRCTVMHRVPPSYYILYYYLVKVTAVMRFWYLM